MARPSVRAQDDFVRKMPKGRGWRCLEVDMNDVPHCKLTYLRFGWWQLKYFWNFHSEPWVSNGLKPPTSNISLENWWLEDEFCFLKWSLFGGHVNFWGCMSCRWISIVYKHYLVCHCNLVTKCRNHCIFSIASQHHHGWKKPLGASTCFFQTQVDAVKPKPYQVNGNMVVPKPFESHPRAVKLRKLTNNHCWKDFALVNSKILECDGIFQKFLK